TGLLEFSVQGRSADTRGSCRRRDVALMVGQRLTEHLLLANADVADLLADLLAQQIFQGTGWKVVEPQLPVLRRSHRQQSTQHHFQLTNVARPAVTLEQSKQIVDEADWPDTEPA